MFYPASFRCFSATLGPADAVRPGSVSVKDYGAVGDGHTDDTSALAKALASGYREVVIPSGMNLSVLSILIAKSGQILRGEDTNNSQITFRPSSLPQCMIVDPSAHDVGINSLRFNWDQPGQPSTMVEMSHTVNCAVEKVSVVGSPGITARFICLKAHNTQGARFASNDFRDVNADVIRPAASRDFLVENNTFNGIQRRDGKWGNRAIIAGSSTNGTIRNNTIIDAQGYGVFAIDIGGASNVTVSDNICRGCYGGIDLEGTYNFNVTKNHFGGFQSKNNWGRFGIMVTKNGPVHDGAITDNVVDGFAIGIFCWYADNVSFTGNTVLNSGIDGIFVRDSRGITIKENTIKNYALARDWVRLRVGSASGIFREGEEVTGLQSGARGFATFVRELRCDPTELVLSQVLGTFRAGERIVGRSGGVAQVVKTLDFSGIRVMHVSQPRTFKIGGNTVDVGAGHGERSEIPADAQ